MAKFNLKGATVSIGGFSGCVESGDIDLGELNLVETTCSTERVKTYEPGTFNAASGSVTINDSANLSDWLAEYGDGSAQPAATTILFTWPDTGAAAASVSGYITNVSFPVGVDQSFSATFSFTGTGALSFTP